MVPGALATSKLHAKTGGAWCVKKNDLCGVLSSVVNVNIV